MFATSLHENEQRNISSETTYDNKITTRKSIFPNFYYVH